MWLLKVKNVILVSATSGDEGLLVSTCYLSTKVIAFLQWEKLLQSKVKLK